MTNVKTEARACKCGSTETFFYPVDGRGLLEFCCGCGWQVPGE